MIDRTILSRYTRAFIEIVIESGNLDRVENQLAEIDKVLKETLLLGKVLRNPLIEKRHKKALLSKVLSESADPTLKNFFFLLVDKKREEVIPFLYEEFSRMADEERNVVKAEVKSAYPLSAQQIQGLTGKLSKISGKKVTLSQSISPDIIGGLIILLGSKIIDASVIGELKKIELCMLQAPLGQET